MLRKARIVFLKSLCEKFNIFKQSFKQQSKNHFSIEPPHTKAPYPDLGWLGITLPGRDGNVDSIFNFDKQ